MVSLQAVKPEATPKQEEVCHFEVLKVQARASFSLFLLQADLDAECSVASLSPSLSACHHASHNDDIELKPETVRKPQ